MAQYATSLLLALSLTISPITVFFFGGIGAKSAAVQLLFLCLTMLVAIAARPRLDFWPRLTIFLIAWLLLAVGLAEASHTLQRAPYWIDEYSLTRRTGTLIAILLIITTGSLAAVNSPLQTTRRALQLACLIILGYSAFHWHRLTGFKVTLNDPRSATILVDPDRDFGANLFSLFALFTATTALFFRQIYARAPILVFSLALAISFGSRNTILAIGAAYGTYLASHLLRQPNFSHWLTASFSAVGGILGVFVLVPELIAWVTQTVFQMNSAGRGLVAALPDAPKSGVQCSNGG